MCLRGILFGGGRAHVMSDLLEPGGGRERSAGKLLKIRTRFEELAARLEQDQKRALEQVVVDGRLPAWFKAVKLGHPLSPADEGERAALLSGLEALAGVR
jgi:hypothetical protein